MSRIIQRRQRPALLQFVSIHDSSYKHNSTSSRETHRASKTASQSFGKADSPTKVATTRASSPTRSITTTSASRTKSAPVTVFVTVTTTRPWLEEDEDEDETPSPTKSVFLPAPPQTVEITISDAPETTSAVFSTTTAGAGSSQIQVGTVKPELSPALSHTARVSLAVLGAISGALLLLIIGIVVWKQNRRRKLSVAQDLSTPAMREPENPFLDPSQTFR